MTDPLRVHVVFEHGGDERPFGSAYVRLLRPLSHPRVTVAVRATFAADYDGQPVDVVVVDRLWRPDVSADKVRRLLGAARSAGAKVVHALDDNFPDLMRERPEWASVDQAEALDALLTGAAGLLVTTQALAERYAALNSNIAVVPNALDERLLARGRWRRVMRTMVPRRSHPVTIGYMGTFTHDADLTTIAPAVRAVCERFGNGLRLQVVGVVGHDETWSALDGVPLEVLPPTPDLAVYPTFLPWFVNAFRWDIGLAPLQLTPFTRGKSDIKFLDYAAAGAACVCSRHPAYERSVVHGSNGWMVEDGKASWQDALSTLVGDAHLRRRLSQGARGYLYSERTVARTADKWPQALERLLSSRPGEAGG